MHGSVNWALAHVVAAPKKKNEASSWASRYQYLSASFVDSRLGLFFSEYGRVGRGLALDEHQPLGPLHLGHVRRTFLGRDLRVQRGFSICSLTSLLEIYCCG